MKAYFFKIALSAFLSLIAFTWLILHIRLSIPAEYWVRDDIVIKKHLSEKIEKPKILIFGGSSALFGFDAAQIESALNIPTINFGLQYELRLEFLLDLVRSQAKPGDTVVLALEYKFYESTDWTSFQLRNAIAWNYAPLDSNSLYEKCIIYKKALSSSIMLDILTTSAEQISNPDRIKARQRTAEEVLAEFNAKFEHPDKKRDTLIYSDLNKNGDIRPVTENLYTLKGYPLSVPNSVDPTAARLLTSLISELKARGITVYFANVPYIQDEQPYDLEAQQAEQKFEQMIRECGSEVIDKRTQLRFPREEIYDSAKHVNATGREKRSRIFIDSMRTRLQLR